MKSPKLCDIIGSHTAQYGRSCVTYEDYLKYRPVTRAEVSISPEWQTYFREHHPLNDLYVSIQAKDFFYLLRLVETNGWNYKRVSKIVKRVESQCQTCPS